MDVFPWLTPLEIVHPKCLPALGYGRPGRPAPGNGPVILAEFGAPIAGRPTWLETSAPREVPQGFAGLVLKGVEASGAAGQLDGLTLLAQCPQPENVILDSGVGPHTAASAAALGAAGVLVSEPLYGCPEFDLPPSMARRIKLADTEMTRRVQAFESPTVLPRTRFGSWLKVRKLGD